MKITTINNKFKALAGLVAIVLLAVTLISFVANRFLTKTNQEIYQQCQRKKIKPALFNDGPKGDYFIA